MEAGLTYQWLGPGILVSAGIGFLLFYFHDRRQASAVWLSFSYLSAAVGFMQIMLVRGDLSLSSPVTIQTSLFVSHTLLAGGIHALYRRRFPMFVYGLPALAALAVVSFSLFVKPDFALRVTADFGFMAFVYALCGLVAWRSRSHRVDAVIAAIFLFQAGVTLIRIGQIYLPGAPPITPQSFGTFYLAAALQTANAFFAIALGVALFTRYFVDALAKLTHLADTDPLTGLLNRRALERRAETLRNFSAPRPVGLIVCDIDHFKRVNDEYGHEAGDQALKAFARMLEEAAGASAVAARLGGEEFCVLLPESTGEMTWLAAIRLRMAAEALRIATSSGMLTLTASFGYREVATGDDLRVAMAEVDAAVYQAKKDGRNLVRMAGSALAQPVRMLDRNGSKS